MHTMTLMSWPQFDARRAFSRFVAFVVAAALVMLMSACTPAQQKTTLQVVTAIHAHSPEVISAADTVAATVAALLPVQAILISGIDLAFDTAAHALDALCVSYMANPSASTLQQIQAAIASLEAQVNSTTLQIAGIKDLQTQNLVLAALKGLVTVINIVFGMIAPTMTTSQLITLRDASTVKLAAVRPYMDEHRLIDAAEAGAFSGKNVDGAFRLAAENGF